MKKAVAVLLAAFAASAGADNEARFPGNATFTTLIVTPLAIEGLTGDAAGNLYTTGRDLNVGVDNCPVWRINAASPSLVVVGYIPNSPACNPSGIAFDSLGNLYVADGGAAATIWKLTPSESTPPLATAFATGVPGTNGLAFDRDGNLWTGDGTTSQGRVWRITAAGANCQTATDCTEVFRIQPMRNGTDLGGRVAAPAGGVGRQNNTVPSNNAQNLVANGLAFDEDGDLFIADTARGAIWKVEFSRRGELKSEVNCDTTFTANTLCLDNVFVAHPYLEGTDGIALDRAGTIWNAANERNAIVAVTKNGRVAEVFRNAPNAALLRNSADSAEGNRHILETPTSPFLLGKRLCVAQSDGTRRDNVPNTAGEVNSSNVLTEERRGKISCMDQELHVPGMRLPVR
jgi:sugar lactone lactonase YvrE